MRPRVINAVRFLNNRTVKGGRWARRGCGYLSAGFDPQAAGENKQGTINWMV
jgi:hypothetical protein